MSKEWTMSSKGCVRVMQVLCKGWARVIAHCMWVGIVEQGLCEGCVRLVLRLYKHRGALDSIFKAFEDASNENASSLWVSNNKRLR